MTAGSNVPWRTIELRYLAHFVNGRGFRSDEWSDTGLPIVRIQDLTGTGTHQNFYDGEVEPQFLIRKGDLLLAWSATIDAYIYRGPDACLNQHIFRVEPRVHKKYLYFAFKNLINHLRTKTHGGGMVHLTKNALLESTFPVPPLQEQNQISSTVDSLLSRITAAEKELDRAEQLLTRLRQSLLTRAFDGSLTASWRQANETESADDLLARISKERETHYRTQLADWEACVAAWEQNANRGKRPTKPRKPKEVDPLTAEELAELPTLPETWRWVQLGTVSYGPEYGTSKKSNPEGSVPVLRMGNLQEGRIEWDDLQYTNDEEDIAQYRLKPGDVLFNRTNSPELVGKTARVVEDRPAVFAGYLVRVNQVSRIDPSYLSHYLNSPFAKSIGAQVKTDGVNQSNINASKLMHYPFPLAPDTEQKEITRVLDLEHYSSRITRKRIEQSYTYLKALRRSILQTAFSGRLTAKWRAEHPELISGENSAEALLARIKEESTT